ncbi:MAG: tRNA lysidine(34) synthetase TilS [Ardenticatenales bacterium]|nr:tRNA lysidine(34) synthetase TilS [Ardenticatenales bacterium]
MDAQAAWLERLRHAVEAGPGVGSTLLVAVSGGGDSVALLHGLVRLRESLALRLVVAHLDHALRPESGTDAAFVGHLSLSLGLQCLRERREVAAIAEREGRNLEDTARRTRYALLESAARAVHANAIALAHTADDQAETMIMHLLRGAGLDGLKGMTLLAPSPLPEARTPLFRPLLFIERAALREWLTLQNLLWQEDATNEELSRLRNRVRHRILPFLEEERPGLRTRLARTAQSLSADHAWLEDETQRAWQRLAKLREGSVEFPRRSFLTLPIPLQRRLLRRAFFQLHPTTRDLSFEQVEQALALAARGVSGARATLPDHDFLTVEQETLVVGKEAVSRATSYLAEPLLLPRAGRVETGRLTVTVKEVGREALPGAWNAFPASVALLDREGLQWPLFLRSPRPEERWLPLGLAGQSVQLKEWMAKKKVPLAQRDYLPLLVDGEDQVLWVVGWQVGEVARVRPTSERLLYVAVEPTAAEGG